MTAANVADGKLDLTKERPQYFRAPSHPELVRLDTVEYLSIDGRGAPGEGQPGHDDFQAAIQALYQVVYPLKMQLKAEGRDFKVCTLEALWWGEAHDASASDFWTGPPEDWHWRLMIMLPDYVGRSRVSEVKSEQARRHDSPMLHKVRIESLREGSCVQMLHVGPYDTEAVTIEAMRSFMAERGLGPRGHHHEVYLSNPQRVAPEKMRTIVRQPVRRK